MRVRQLHHMGKSIQRQFLQVYVPVFAIFRGTNQGYNSKSAHEDTLAHASLYWTFVVYEEDKLPKYYENDHQSD
ncbi:hypothetical protein FGO68_gene41 [Halteria grandinella]|uniref:Uncharacterized protein n=1 Tax=Halteria grandinella TaxID=5974 RepID=A0A8J8T9K7_HALGN|nr:hypothetical protein FGO68_gene41 [Halteria grandinella]